jgi:hypothetical protein
MREEAFEHFEVAAACGIEPRRAAVDVAPMHVGAGAQQGVDDLDVATTRGLVQRAAMAGIARVGLRLVLEQELHAGDVVFFGARGGQQCGRGVGAFGLGAAFEQETREAPVARRAGDAERGPAVVVDRVDVRGGIAQQRGDAGIGAARGMVQRRVAVGVGDARIGAVGQQGHHRFRTAMPTVARGGQQGRHAAVGGVEVDAVLDQRAQQAQVREDRRQHRQRAVVVARRRQGMRIGAGIQQRQRTIDAAATRGGIERGVQVVFRERRVGEGRRVVFDGGQELFERERRGRRDALQQQVQGGRERGEPDRDRPPQACREEPRPCQHQDRAEQQRHDRRHAQATPGADFHFAQRAPGRAGGAAFAFQRVPDRPGAPQQQQGDAGNDAQADRGGQAAGFAQRCERPGHQRPEGHGARHPHRRERSRIAAPALGGPGAPPPRDGQRQRRLRERTRDGERPCIQAEPKREQHASDGGAGDAQAGTDGGGKRLGQLRIRHRCPNPRSSDRAAWAETARGNRDRRGCDERHRRLPARACARRSARPRARSAARPVGSAAASAAA